MAEWNDAWNVFCYIQGDSCMGRILKSMALGLLICLWVTMSAAEEIAANEITREQIKELGEQVQDIKNDVLDISTRLIQLEEKLVYPPATQISIFLAVAQGDKFRLDAVKIKMDGKQAVHYIYSAKELEALQHGGVQRIYMGNIQTGEHWLEVSLLVKSISHVDYLQHANYIFTKDTGKKLIEITIADPDSINQGISFKD